MSIANSDLVLYGGLVLLIISAVLVLVFALLRKEFPYTLREIPTFARLRRAIGLAIEDGSRVHFSIGRGGLNMPWSAAAFVGLATVRRVAELTSVSDRPSIVTSGDGALNVLSQDTLKASYVAAVAPERYDASMGQVTGLTPFSYAAGAIPVMRDENISTNVIVGNFGLEVALMADAAERQDNFTMVASDNIPAQAVLFAAGSNPLIGEETVCGWGLCPGRGDTYCQFAGPGFIALGAHRCHRGWRSVEAGGDFVRDNNHIFPSNHCHHLGCGLVPGYFLPGVPLFAALRTAFLNWVMILAATAVFVGIANLFTVHFQKLKIRKDAAYSVILLIFLAGTFILGLISPASPAMDFVFASIQIPVETSLMALLAVSLLYATIRLVALAGELHEHHFHCHGTDHLFGDGAPAVHRSAATSFRTGCVPSSPKSRPPPVHAVSCWEWLWAR